MKMIKIVLIILFISILIATNSFTEEKIRNLISINSLGITLFGYQNIEFERILGNKSSMAFYWAESGYASAEISDIEFAITEQKVTYRYYLTENSPKGSWIGSNVAYSTSNLKKNNTDYAYKVSMLILGVEVGYRWLFSSWNNFNIAPFALLRFRLTDNLLGTKESSKDFNYPFVGFNFGFGLNIGWGW